MERSHEHYTKYTFQRNELDSVLDSLREGGFKIKPVGADYGVYAETDRVSIISYVNGRAMQMDVKVMSSLDKFLLRQFSFKAVERLKTFKS